MYVALKVIEYSFCCAAAEFLNRSFFQRKLRLSFSQLCMYDWTCHVAWLEHKSSRKWRVVLEENWLSHLRSVWLFNSKVIHWKPATKKLNILLFVREYRLRKLLGEVCAWSCSRTLIIPSLNLVSFKVVLKRSGFWTYLFLKIVTSRYPEAPWWNTLFERTATDFLSTFE